MLYFNAFSLFGSLRECAKEHRLETIEIADGGLLLYDETFFIVDVQTVAVVELRDDAAWEQKPGIFGHMQPQLTASLRWRRCHLSLFRHRERRSPWTNTILEIQDRSSSGSTAFCLLNRYRSGADSMGLHSDDEPEMGKRRGSLSLETTEHFAFSTTNPEETEPLLWAAVHHHDGNDAAEAAL
jgi:hypothetical protein